MRLLIGGTIFLMYNICGGAIIRYLKKTLDMKDETIYYEMSMAISLFFKKKIIRHQFLHLQ